MEKWGDGKIKRKLPLQVDEIAIHPERMPLSTMQFTERLGYRKENAIEMLTMGCYNTLWTLQNYLEEGTKYLDERDQVVLKMVRKWTGIEEFPEDGPARDDLQKKWRCKRTVCVYHAKHCPHGAKPKKASK